MKNVVWIRRSRLGVVNLDRLVSWHVRRNCLLSTIYSLADYHNYAQQSQNPAVLDDRNYIARQKLKKKFERKRPATYSNRRYQDVDSENQKSNDSGAVLYDIEHENGDGDHEGCPSVSPPQTMNGTATEDDVLATFFSTIKPVIVRRLANIWTCLLITSERRNCRQCVAKQPCRLSERMVCYCFRTRTIVLLLCFSLTVVKNFHGFLRARISWAQCVTWLARDGFKMVQVNARALYQLLSHI